MTRIGWNYLVSEHDKMNSVTVDTGSDLSFHTHTHTHARVRACANVLLA
jgi:hypothetical protein